MRKLVIILLFFIFLLCENIYSQRTFVTGQYVYDLFLVNPSAAGMNNDCYSINGYFQKRWITTDLTPTTQMLTFHKAFPSQLGIGSWVFNDRNGNHHEIGFQQTFAYGVTLSKTKRREINLLFGLSILGSQRSIEMSSQEMDGVIDPVIDQGTHTGYGINANAGAMLSINNNWHVGFSITNLFPFTNSLYSKAEEPEIPPDVNFHIGKVFKIADRNIYLEPLFYYKWNSYMDSRTDINFKVHLPANYSDYTWWGVLALRRTLDQEWGDNLGFAATAGIIKGGFKVGIECQLGLTRAQDEFGSAYQLIIGYHFCRDRSKEPFPCSKILEDKHVEGGW